MKGEDLPTPPTWLKGYEAPDPSKPWTMGLAYAEITEENRYLREQRRGQ